MPRVKKTVENKEENEVAAIDATVRDLSIIKYMIGTEKTNILREKNNSIVLAVDVKARKDEIKSAVEKIFGVKVTSVNTINPLSKKKRVGRYFGTLSRIKKAIVKLDSSVDLGKIQDQVATEEMKATLPSEE